MVDGNPGWVFHSKVITYNFNCLFIILKWYMNYNIKVITYSFKVIIVLKWSLYNFKVIATILKL